MANSIEVEERAAAWLAQRDSEQWSASDQAQLDAWLEESTAHVVAFVRLETVWNQARRLKALSAKTAPGDVPSTQEWQLAQVCVEPARKYVTGVPSKVRRWSLVAGLLVIVATSVTLYVGHSGSVYRTPVGGITSLPMSDGSKVTLNTDSRIRMALTQAERHVELERGEAFFEVAKDPQRPFVVVAGSKRVVAVGTQFSVRRDQDEVRVVVTEGKVRIEDAVSSQDEEGRIILSAGKIALASQGSVLVQEKTVPELRSDLSWRSGYLMFRDTALVDAVAEFNRYNTSKIVIGDPALAAMRVSGKFRAAQHEAFVRLLEQGFPVRAQRFDERIVLTRR
jgi:transmembrane sensor